jgi:calcium-dependent protein kinase
VSTVFAAAMGNKSGKQAGSVEQSGSERTSQRGSQRSNIDKVGKDDGFAHSQFIIDNPGKITEFYDMQSKTLGEGSFGAVCIGTNKSTKFQRAIKKISKKSIKTPEKMAKMKFEIDIMKTMDHPNIVKLYESFEDNQILYLVMELCTGGELFDRIIDAGSFSEPKAAHVMQQMLGAIFYMHERHICHRDLKPENFLFSTKEDIDKSVLKIIDFGLSCKFEPGQKLKTKAGTPYYVAPEILGGSYDELSDEWSCGVIMYILLCGAPPFGGNDDREILQAVKTAPLEFSDKEWKPVSKDATDVIKGLVTRDVSKRMSAKNALNTTWIKEKAPNASDAVLQQSLVDNLKSFRSVNKLKKAALHIIAGRLNDSQIKDLKDVFMALDSDRDGCLTHTELKAGIEKAGIKDIPPDLEKIMAEVDSDGSSKIDYTEFLAATLEKKTYARKDVCWAAFRVFDRDGNGQISRKELEEVLGNDEVRDEVGQDMIDKIIGETDTDGDGNISFEEFMAMMQK